MSKIYPYAGFWRRALAFIIDSLVLSVPMAVVYFIILVPQGIAFAKLASSGAEPSPDVMMGMVGRYFASIVLIWFLTILGSWLYFALMESGKRQATLGKMALGIKVVDEQGQRLSFARTSGRFFAKIISGMTLYFGFYMAGFTQKRQALHDIVATTFVVDKKYQPSEELPALRFSKGGCAAGIIVALAPVIFYFLMIVTMFFFAFSEGQQKTLPTTTTITQAK